MNIACRSTQNAARIKRLLSLRIVIKPLNKKNEHNKFFIMLKCNSINVHSNTPQLASQKSTPDGHIRDFGNFFNGLAKSPRVLPSSWILNECNLHCEILLSVRGLYDKNSASHYCFNSDVMYKCYKRLVYTHPDLLARFCKVNLSRLNRYINSVLFTCIRKRNFILRPSLWKHNIQAKKIC